MSEFYPHGEADIYWKDNCLLIKPRGGINVEGAQILTSTAAKAIDNTQYDEWYRIEYFESRYTLPIPDAEVCLLESLLYSRDNGCKLVCLISDSAIMQKIFFT